MKSITVNNKEYEIYLSSNGVLKIEEMLGFKIQDINLDSVGFKELIILFSGVLYQKNKLTLEYTADLFDKFIEEGHTMQDVSNIISKEIENWSGKFNINNDSNNDNKKK